MDRFHVMRADSHSLSPAPRVRVEVCSWTTRVTDVTVPVEAKAIEPSRREYRQESKMGQKFGLKVKAALASEEAPVETYSSKFRLSPIRSTHAKARI
jgi:hypothetical protein